MYTMSEEHSTVHIQPNKRNTKLHTSMLSLPQFPSFNTILAGSRWNLRTFMSARH